MKKLLLVFLVGFPLFADTPILLKTFEETHFVPPSAWLEWRCEIYATKVVIKKRIADEAWQTEVKNLSTDVASLTPLLEEALKGKMKFLQGPTDYHTQKWLGYLYDNTHGMREVLLTQDAGETYINQSPAAAELIKKIDKVCPN